MMESIRSRSDRSSSSDIGNSMTRRTRSSDIASPPTSSRPTAPYKDSDHGRLGNKFSILKPGVPRNQTPQASFPKILALPPWLQDTVTELDASHPLRTVFPVLQDASDPCVAKDHVESLPDHPTPRRASPDDVNWFFHLPSTPSQIPPRHCPPDSDTSSDEPQQFPTQYPLYHNNSVLHLQPGSPTPSVSAVAKLEGAFSTATNSRSSSSAPVNATNTTHISGFKTKPLSASSLNHDSPDPVSPIPRHNVEYDGIFRYNPSQVNSATVPTISNPSVLERPIQVYFDSPIEDPINSDPSDPSDYDPFKLDPEEFKNLDFKWAPFGLQSGIEESTASEPETNTQSPGTDEVIVFDGLNRDLAHLHLLLSGQLTMSLAEGVRISCPGISSGLVKFPEAKGTEINS